MRPTRSWLTIGGGAAVLLFGLLCLNYTRADGLEHHQQQALRYHLLAPSPGIFRIGVVTTVAGAGLLGYGIGSRRKRDWLRPGLGHRRE